MNHDISNMFQESQINFHIGLYRCHGCNISNFNSHIDDCYRFCNCGTYFNVYHKKCLDKNICTKCYLCKIVYIPNKSRFKEAERVLCISWMFFLVAFGIFITGIVTLSSKKPSYVYIPMFSISGVILLFHTIFLCYYSSDYVPVPYDWRVTFTKKNANILDYVSRYIDDIETATVDDTPVPIACETIPAVNIFSIDTAIAV